MPMCVGAQCIPSVGCKADPNPGPKALSSKYAGRTQGFPQYKQRHSIIALHPLISVTSLVVLHAFCNTVLILYFYILNFMCVYVYRMFTIFYFLLNSELNRRQKSFLSGKFCFSKQAEQVRIFVLLSDTNKSVVSKWMFIFVNRKI